MIAYIFGVTSEKMTIARVIIIVARVIPAPPKLDIKISVNIAVASILNKLLAMSTPVMNWSLVSFIFNINIASLLPCSLYLRALSFDIAVKAVSDPEDIADNNSNINIVIILNNNTVVILLF